MNVWVLNLDAEDELALGGRAHTPGRVMEERIRGLLPRLAALVRDEFTLYPLAARGVGDVIGRAWCPTRWALKTMHDAGVTPAPHPSMEVLCRVNHRRFSAELGQHLPGAHYVESLTSLPPGQWLLKRPYGYAGRGRRKVTGGAFTPADEAFIAASSDGLQVEPWVERVLDCAQHGWLEPSGDFTLGQPTVQHVDEHGAWQATEVAPNLKEAPLLHAEATRVAHALHAAGYFGPFNLDGYRWRAEDGTEHFQPRSEINARFSMGWAIGMGDYRPR